MQSLTAYCFSVLVVWSNTVIGSVVISKERFKLDLCSPGWLSSNIIHGPTLSKNDRHLCMRDEHIRRDSHQNSLRKNTTFCHEERAMSRFSSPVFMVYAWNAWDQDPPFGDQNACILWLGLSCGSPSNYFLDADWHTNKEHDSGSRARLKFKLWFPLGVSEFCSP